MVKYFYEVNYMSKHQKNCNCNICKQKGLNKIRKMTEIQDQEQEHLEKFGFYTHYVLSDNANELCNYHTHGLPKTRNHMDLQIVFPIPPKLAHNIFWTIVRLINEGFKFENNTISLDILHDNMPVKFVEVTETNRKVLRVLLPDKNRKLPGEEGCNPKYQRQLLTVLN